MQQYRINPMVDEDFASWFAVYQRSERARDDENSSGWHPDEIRARAMDDGGPDVTHLLAFGDPGAAPVSVAKVEETRSDPTPWWRTELHVDPLLRGRGFGSAHLAELETYVRTRGRREIVVAVIEGANEVGRSPNRTFAPRHGYILGDESARRDLAWPYPPERRDELLARWRPLARDYEILTWTTATPERWLSDRARMSAVMPSEAPYADLEPLSEEWDADRVRRFEERVASMGRELLVAAARHVPSDSLVAFSELTVSRESPDTAYQWDTLVLRSHRGHRLGGLMKLATMELLDHTGLAVRRISTFNSLLNTPMIRVNEELGARLAGANLLWRKTLSVK